VQFLESKIRERGEKQPRHHVRNTVFAEFGTDHAMTRTYFAATVVDKAGERPYLTDTGIFEDSVVRTPQGWRIRKRVVVYDKHPGLEH